MKVREFLLKETTKVSIPLATFILVAVALVTFGFTFSKTVTEINMRLDNVEQVVEKNISNIDKINIVQSESQAQFAEINTNLEWIKAYLKGSNNE